MPNPLTTSCFFNKGLGIYQILSLYLMLFRGGWVHARHPNCTSCFFEEVKHKPKSLIYYDVVFKYFLGILHMLNTFFSHLVSIVSKKIFGFLQLYYYESL
jgi:hypothetical protein